MSQNIGDYQVRGPQRGSRVGTWQSLAGPDGQQRGGLRLDTVALDQAVADRFSEAVRAARALNLPGLNTLIGQVHDGQYLWLISDVPANPTLTAIPGLPPAVALLIAVDIGETLVALHAAGLAHGDVTGETVVITAEGRAKLIECGYAHALAGTTPGPGHDVTGWVTLARNLAASCGNNPLLLKAASTAEGIGGSTGLISALAELATSADQIPGYGERSGLAVLATIAPAPSPPVIPAAPPSTPDTVTVKLPPGPAVYSPGSAAVYPPSDVDSTLSPQELETRLGKRNEEVLRFGRGVSARPAPTPAWQGSTAAYPQAPYPPKRNRRLLISIMSGVITVVLLSVVGWILIERLTPLAITGVSVALAQPMPANGCDIQVDVVGTITSNGGSGSFDYRWVRSDGATTAVFSESVSYGQKVTQVHLLWKFSGKGSLNARATLQIVTPHAITSAVDFTYTCK